MNESVVDAVFKAVETRYLNGALASESDVIFGAISVLQQLGDKGKAMAQKLGFRSMGGVVSERIKREENYYLVKVSTTDDGVVEHILLRTARYENLNTIEPTSQEYEDADNKDEELLLLSTSKMQQDYAWNLRDNQPLVQYSHLLTPI